MPGDQAATMAFVGACTQLGFDEETCTGLAVIAQGAVEATTICYDVVTHDFYPAADASACLKDIFSQMQYGIVMAY